jgi:hypothetical protein
MIAARSHVQGAVVQPRAVPLQYAYTESSSGKQREFWIAAGVPEDGARRQAISTKPPSRIAVVLTVFLGTSL